MSAVSVPAAGWREAVAEAVAAGYRWPDFLTAIDEGASIAVVARLLRPSDGVATTLASSVPADAAIVPSVADLVPGFAWHERETADLLGIAFAGASDTRPLVRRERASAPPLRRSTVIAARATRPWPGAAEAEVRVGAEGMQRRSGNPSRRRQRPPAVPEGWPAP